jgi:hypothetical protein
LKLVLQTANGEDGSREAMVWDAVVWFARSLRCGSIVENGNLWLVTPLIPAAFD